MSDEHAAPTPRLITVERTQTVVVRATVPTGELPAFFDRSFSSLSASLARRGIAPAGPAFAFWPRPPGRTSELEVGFPVDAPVARDGDVVPSVLPAGPVATVVHRGGYDGMAGAWSELQEWLGRQGLRASAGSWEVYLTEPTPHTDPAANATQLFQPLSTG